FTTERSSAIAPSSRTKPWSRTSIESAWVSSVVTVTSPGSLVCPPDGHSRRHLRLVVSLVAARVLPGGDAAGGLPPLLRGAVRHGRAEHDGIPAAFGGAVRALGSGGAGRIPLRGQDAGRAARPDLDVLRTGARARRPARAGAGRGRERARRRPALVRTRLGRL